MSTENTPKDLTALDFLENYSIDDKDVFGRHDEYYRLDHLMEEFVKLKLQQANKKEILGDRRIVELEHDKTVLKSQLKSKDAMLDEMANVLNSIINPQIDHECYIQLQKGQEALTKYEKSK